jgi:hypothetical protein
MNFSKPNSMRPPLGLGGAYAFTRAAFDMVSRADATIATTGTSGHAAELSSETYGEFLKDLQPFSGASRLIELASHGVKEVTTVTAWDEKGRIKTFEKKVSIEEKEDAASSEQVAAINAKIDRGDPITKEERFEVLAETAVRIQQEIRDAMQDARTEKDNPANTRKAFTTRWSKRCSAIYFCEAHSEKREEVRAQMKEHIAGEVRLLLRFVEVNQDNRRPR